MRTVEKETLDGPLPLPGTSEGAEKEATCVTSDGEEERLPERHRWSRTVVAWVSGTGTTPGVWDWHMNPYLGVV